ncbi:MAG: hypothetical protein JWM64_985 [Frankiales bacterium]|nr:hypothetical protein [Frankiales bacterium]
MPRVVNAALALFLLVFLAPAVDRAAGLDLWVQIVLAVLALPVVLVVVLCLCSAARPGSLGRAARRARAKRQAKAAPPSA